MKRLFIVSRIIVQMPHVRKFFEKEEKGTFSSEGAFFFLL